MGCVFCSCWLFFGVFLFFVLFFDENLSVCYLCLSWVVLFWSLFRCVCVKLWLELLNVYSITCKCVSHSRFCVIIAWVIFLLLFNIFDHFYLIFFSFVLGISEDDVVVLWVSRLVPEKRPDIWMSAVKRCVSVFWLVLCVLLCVTGLFVCLLDGYKSYLNKINAFVFTHVYYLTLFRNFE